MKTIDIFQVDAFTKSIFKGNPAAVCPVLEWPSDALMQWIATENNVSETAFVLLDSNPLEIRWFSPTVEVDLCGHATLATARILFDEYLRATEKTIIFQYKNCLTIEYKKILITIVINIRNLQIIHVIYIHTRATNKLRASI